MAALTKATPRKYDADVGPMFHHLPVKTGVQVWLGGAYAIELATGFVYVPVGNDAAEVFIGFADESVLGDGAKLCRFRALVNVELPITLDAVPNKDIGKPVYIVNDGTFSLSDTTADLLIGRVHRGISTALGIIHCRAASLRGPDMPA